MNFQKALDSVYGVQFRSIPADGKMRKFKFCKGEGFAILFPDCGAFGCFDRGEYYAWAGGKYVEVKFPADKPKRRMLRSDLELERMIVDIGNSLSDSGAQFNDVDMGRYIEALANVMEAANAE